MPCSAAKRTPELVAQVRAMKAQGVPMQAIGRRLGLAYGTVKRCLKGDGLAGEGNAPIPVAAARACWREGLSQTQAANRLGVSRSAVGRRYEQFEAEAAAARDKARAAAAAAHREGGAIPSAKPAALAPNPAPVALDRMVASLVAKGMRPEVARLTAKAWGDRHARTMQGRGR
jgi:transposase